MNDLIRPSLYGAFHFIWPAQTAPRFVPTVRSQDLHVEGSEMVDIVGPICEGADFLAKDRSIPPVQRGDLMAVFTAGAYGFTMASNYNARPRARRSSSPATNSRSSAGGRPTKTWWLRSGDSLVLISQVLEYLVIFGMGADPVHWQIAPVFGPTEPRPPTPQATRASSSCRFSGSFDAFSKAWLSNLVIVRFPRKAVSRFDNTVATRSCSVNNCQRLLHGLPYQIAAR